MPEGCQPEKVTGNFQPRARVTPGFSLPILPLLSEDLTYSQVRDWGAGEEESKLSSCSNAQGPPRHPSFVS